MSSCYLMTALKLINRSFPEFPTQCLRPAVAAGYIKTQKVRTLDEEE